jgi:hypothetical protein
MEDSFEARLAGQKPVQEKKKSGKGWMISFIITLVLLIGVGVFAGILFFNKGDDGKAKIAELEDQIKEKDEKIKEKDEKIKECEESAAAAKDCDASDTKTESTVQKDVINIDFDGLKAAVKQIDGNMTSYTNIVIKMAEGGKYIIADGSVGTTGNGYELYMYKENKAGATWKKLYDTQAEISCDLLEQTQKDIFHGVEYCRNSEGGYRAL